MTSEEIQAEVSKLNEAQRAVLRKTVGQGALERLVVTQIGPYTQVNAKMYGHNHLVLIGPRGKVMNRSVFG